jgi:hypothetical protein
MSASCSACGRHRPLIEGDKLAGYRVDRSIKARPEHVDEFLEANRV